MILIRQLTFWDHIDRMYIRKPYTCSVSMVTEKKKIDIIDLNHEISLYWRIVREKTKKLYQRGNYGQFQRGCLEKNFILWYSNLLTFLKFTKYRKKVFQMIGYTDYMPEKFRYHTVYLFINEVTIE